MNGTITFPTLEDLAEFLKHFTGATATFEVREERGVWVMKFNGGF